MKISELKPNPQNPRKITDEKLKMLKKSMEEFGDLSGIFYNRRTGRLGGGHQRVKVIPNDAEIVITKTYSEPTKVGTTAEGYIEYLGERLNYREVDWDEIREKAANIAANKGAGEWDMKQLTEWIHELDENNIDLDLTMFDREEIENIMAPTYGQNEKEDDIPEVKESICKPGDLWILGDHRLLCGDCTDLEQVKKLINNEKINMVFTDPPYGMSYGGGRAEGNHVLDKKGGVKIKDHGMIKGDDLRGEELCRLLTDSLAGAVAMKNADAAVYVCLTWRTYSEFIEAFEKVGLKLQNCIVWNKRSIGLGYSHYRPQHEFIFYCGGEWNGRKDESDVWEMTRGNTGEYVHPTQKPVELIERAIRNSSKKLGVILDLFGGLGSTLIACEKTNRKCFAMEIEPRYCDVIIKRWEDFSGKKAELQQA